MHEDVFAGLGGDEAVALVCVEPFHGSNRHERVPSLHRLGGIDQRRTYLAPTARDKLDLRVAKQSVNLWQATVAATACHRASGHAEPGRVPSSGVGGDLRVHLWDLLCGRGEELLWRLLGAWSMTVTMLARTTSRPR